MKHRKCLSMLLTLALTLSLMALPAAAAGGPRLVAGSTPASSQQVGFTNLPADAQSFQVTFNLSAQGSCVFEVDSSLADRPGVYTTYKQNGTEVTVYVTTKSGVLAENGSLTLGTLSVPDTAFTVTGATAMKLLGSGDRETIYDTVTDSGSDNSGSTGGEDNSNSGGSTGGGSNSGGSTGGGSNSGSSGNGGGSGNSSSSGSTGGGTDSGTNQPVPQPFDDVPANAWYAKAVQYVSERGLMSGTDAGTFSPNIPMSRAMIWTVLAAYNGANTSGGSPWYAPGQRWAVANGVSDGTNPSGSITREQLATMLWRAAGSPSTSRSLSNYVDASSVSDWAVEALAWAVDEGILSGMGGGTLAPQATATRAQVAVMLMQFVESMEA